MDCAGTRDASASESSDERDCPLRRLARAAALVASVAATLLAAPASARAATSCDFIATSRLLNVEMSAAGDGAVLRVSPGGDIVVSAGGGELVCFGTEDRRA